MALVHTPLPADKPGFHGEYLAGQRLSAIDDIKGLELWFNVELIGAREIDFLLFSPDLGLFLCETKGNNIQDIDRSMLRDAIRQCKQASYSLRNTYERSRPGKRAPFMQLAICLPLVREESWLTKFADEPEMLHAAQYALFLDHLESSASLQARLQGLHEVSLSSVVTPQSARKETAEAREFLAFLKASLTAESPEPNNLLTTKLSLSGLRILSEKVVGELRRSALIEGLEGSGKTTLLKFIGLSLAKRGIDVAFLTQTMAAATQAQREIQAERVTGDFQGSFNAFYMEDFERQLIQNRPTNDEAGEPFIYGAMLVDDIQDCVGRYPNTLQLIDSCTDDQTLMIGAKNRPASLWLSDELATKALEDIFVKGSGAAYELEGRGHYAGSISKLVDHLAAPINQVNTAPIDSSTETQSGIRVLPEPNTWHVAVLAEFLLSEINDSIDNHGAPSLIVMFDTYGWDQPNSQYKQFLAAAELANIRVHDLVPTGATRRELKVPEAIVFTHHRYLQGLHANSAILVNPSAIYTNWASGQSRGATWENHMRYALTRGTRRLTMLVPPGGDLFTERLIALNLHSKWAAW